MKQASLRVQFGVHCIRSSCILSLMYNLYKVIIILTSSSVDGFYTKLSMNLTFCAMNHGADEVTFRGNGVNNLHNLQQ
jgi:hypothetical protein